MRRILPGDLLALAALLAMAEASDRSALARRLLVQARAADTYRKRLGTWHPCWGNGSLMAVVLAEGGADCGWTGKTGMLEALSVVCDEVLRDRAEAAQRRGARS